MTQNDHSDVYIIPPNFVRDGTLFSGRQKPECGRSSIFGTRWNPLFSIFKSWNKREDLCRDHPDSALVIIG